MNVQTSGCICSYANDDSQGAGGEDHYVRFKFFIFPNDEEVTVYHNTCCIVISHDFFLALYMTWLPVVDSGLYTNGICQSAVLLQAS